MSSAGGTVTLVQHMNHLAARIQAVVRKVDSLADQIEEIRNGAAAASSGAAKAEEMSALRDDIKRDVIRERAMMEASLEHRIDQQVNRLMIDKDQTAVLARLEKRLDDVDGTLIKFDARIADTGKRGRAVKTADASTSTATATAVEAA